MLRCAAMRRGFSVPLKMPRRSIPSLRQSARAKAAWALGDIGGPIAFDTLLASLGDDVQSVRCNAAAGLGKIGDVRAVPRLVGALLDKYANTRANAKEALSARLGISDAIRRIHALIEYVRSNYDNCMAIAMLKYYSSPDAQKAVHYAMDLQSSSRSCMSCGKKVPSSTKVGDLCPHCSVVFGRQMYTRA